MPEQMTTLTIGEVSGVGPRVGGPAHGRQGFNVIKSADQLDAVMDRIASDTDPALESAPTDGGVAPVTKETGMSDDATTDTDEGTPIDAGTAAELQAAAAAAAAAAAGTVAESQAQAAAQAVDTVTITKSRLAELQAAAATADTVADLRKQVDEMTHERRIEKATVQVRDQYANLPGVEPAEFAEHLVKMEDAVPETAKFVHERLTQVDKAFKASAAFATHGSGAADASAAGETWLRKSKELSIEKGISEHEAMLLFLDLEPELAAQLEAEELAQPTLST